MIEKVAESRAIAVKIGMLGRALRNEAAGNTVETGLAEDPPACRKGRREYLD